MTDPAPAVPPTPATPTPAPAPAPGPAQPAPDPGGANTPGDPASPPADQPSAAPDPAESVFGEGSDSGSWSEPGEAFSRPGSGTVRNEHMKAAARKFVVDEVEGDLVAGHKIVLNLADESVQVAELSIDLLEPVRFAFVEPVNWVEISTRFAKKRTVIVRGRTGFGKDATAIRLLTGEVGRIYHLDPGTDVTFLAESITKRTESIGRDERGIGFLLCQPTEAGKLRGYTFYALEKALTAANARLVITMPPEIVPADAELEPFVLDLGETTVSHRRIVQSHLSWRCNDEEAVVKLLANPGVQELIDELERDGYTCRSAAELASIISTERTDEGTVNLARVRARRRQQHDHAFDVWFDSLRGAEERSFAVALAVLDGLPYEDVADAARRLRAKLDPAHQIVVSGGARPELRLARRDLLQTPTNRLLDTVRAVQRDEELRYEYGMVPVCVVAYRDERYPMKVLERVWRGHQIQPTMLNWLYELIVAPSDRVRYFAATTLGVLARFSFDYLRSSSLERWADSRDFRLREAVAYALREPAADPRLAASVTRMVNGWYANKGSPFRQATAARAFGVCAGHPDPAVAIDRLGRLATIDNYHIAVGIGNALADLILDDPRQMAPQVCDALVAWFADPLRTRSAQLAFLILASTLVTWERPDDRSPEVQWPSLLRLAEAMTELREPLRVLWRHLVVNPVLFQPANSVLTGWVASAERDNTQLGALLQLIATVVQEPVPALPGARGNSHPRLNSRAVRNLRMLSRDWIAPQNLTPLPRAHGAMNGLFNRLEGKETA